MQGARDDVSLQLAGTQGAAFVQAGIFRGTPLSARVKNRDLLAFHREGFALTLAYIGNFTYLM
jgi:hypothetical protein